MSLVITHPETLATFAGHLNGVGPVMAAQNAAAAAATTGLPPVAADEVSAFTATQFNADAAMYHAIGAQGTAIREMFVAILGANAGSYAVTEAANAIAAR